MVGNDHYHAVKNGGVKDSSMNRRLFFSIVLNSVIVFAEVAGGMLSGSLSLLSDALHNLTDVAALAFALAACRLNQRPPSIRHTYGLGRVEVVSAIVNSIGILMVGTLICREALVRLLHPQPVIGGLMLAVAAIGLIANMISVFLLKWHDKSDLNMRGAFLHLLQDTLSSMFVVLAALLSGTQIGPYLDPVVSILVIILIVRSSWRLLNKSLQIILESSPEDLDVKAMKKDIEKAALGEDLHHIHVWEIKPRQRMMTTHVQINDFPLSEVDRVLRTIHERLAVEWSISHAVLEPEFCGCGTSDLLGSNKSGKGNASC